MRILLPIGAFYPDQTGGPSNSLYWLAKALTKKGINVEVVTTNRGIIDLPLNKKLTTDYGNVIYCKTKIHYFPVLMLFNVFKLIHKADIILLTAIFYPPSWITAIIATIVRKKIIWSTRGEFYEEALGYSSWKKKPFVFFFKYFISSKLFFHTTSRKESDNTRKVLGNSVNIIEIPNMLELPIVEERDLKEKYFLYIGRIHPEKALVNLIYGLKKSEVFKASDLVFKIAGNADNSYGRTLKKIVDENGLNKKVNFIGHIEGREKQKLYANSYFTFLVSHNENFGNVVIESLGQGTPVVASHGIPWQQLAEKGAGFWIENSPMQITKTIDKIINLDHNEYSSYRKNALSLVQTEYDINKNVDKWIKVLSYIHDTNKINNYFTKG